MSTPLMRESLAALYATARRAAPHAGLLLQQGWAEEAEGGAKAEHVLKVCEVNVDSLYDRAFHRWREATADQTRFRQLRLALKSRLFIGTAGGGALETSCAISHSYGVPYIPGSSVKGVVNAHARQRLGNDHKVCDELFGSGSGPQRPAGIAGLIRFHDAWWVPRSAKAPLVPEVVTSHHPEYYSSDGRCLATDFDSPVPNAQVAVQGSFLFVLEGPNAWLGLAAEVLEDALLARGIGAKTRAGYGYFKRQASAGPARPSGGSQPGTCTWVDETIADLMKESRAPAGDVLRGRALAKRWAAIEDAELKREAGEDIRRRWQAEGWWDEPPGKAARDAKAIYEASE